MIDLEIEQASYAGLDYWAFVAYGNGNPMSTALHYYLSSKKSHLVKFCFFTELARWGSTHEPPTLAREHIELMKRPEYVRVNDGRPLYFLGFIDKRLLTQRWGGPHGLIERLDQFRSEAVKAGVGNPYIVLAGPFDQANSWTSLGGDAIGAYSLGDARGSGDYSSLRRSVEERWRTLSRNNLAFIPTVMAGLDRRPRVEHPVPWEPSQKPNAGMDYYYGQPNSLELSDHIKHAIEFVASQPPHLRAPAILIYAWNENDEGGWLIPTLPCNTKHLEDARRALKPAPESPPPSCSLR
ncbi:hypothetical protein [Rhodopseudomonas palustris]|uniref:hypothetical protein n=1 Tax=Rhodopseudomonas palustris TaxID=1076 RepID=UPI001F26C7F5|nr:hypothetical protein [Rhodopseudomonas palustris]